MRIPGSYGNLMVSTTNKKGGEASFEGTAKNRWFNLPASWLEDIPNNAFRIEFSIYIGSYDSTAGEYILMSLGNAALNVIPPGYAFQLTMIDGSRRVNIYSKTPSTGWTQHYANIFFVTGTNTCFLERYGSNFTFSVNGKSAPLTNSGGLVSFFDGMGTNTEEWVFGKRNFWDTSQLSNSYWYYLRLYVMKNATGIQLQHAYEMDIDTNSEARTIYDRVGDTSGILYNANVVKTDTYDRTLVTREQRILLKTNERLTEYESNSKITVTDDGEYLIAKTTDTTTMNWAGYGFSSKVLLSGNVSFICPETGKNSLILFGLFNSCVPGTNPYNNMMYGFQIMNDTLQLYHRDSQITNWKYTPGDIYTIKWEYGQYAQLLKNGALFWEFDTYFYDKYELGYPGFVYHGSHDTNIPIKVSMYNHSITASGYRKNDSYSRGYLEWNQCYNPLNATSKKTIRNMTGLNTYDLELNNVLVKQRWLIFNGTNSYAKIPDESDYHKFFNDAKYFTSFVFKADSDGGQYQRLISLSPKSTMLRFVLNYYKNERYLLFAIRDKNNNLSMMNIPTSKLQILPGDTVSVCACVNKSHGRLVIRTDRYAAVMCERFDFPLPDDIVSLHLGTIYGGIEWFKGGIGNIKVGNRILSNDEMFSMVETNFIER